MPNKKLNLNLGNPYKGSDGTEYDKLYDIVQPIPEPTEEDLLNQELGELNLDGLDIKNETKRTDNQIKAEKLKEKMRKLAELKKSPKQIEQEAAQQVKTRESGEPNLKKEFADGGIVDSDYSRFDDLLLAKIMDKEDKSIDPENYKEPYFDVEKMDFDLDNMVRFRASSPDSAEASLVSDLRKTGPYLKQDEVIPYRHINRESDIESLRKLLDYRRGIEGRKEFGCGGVVHKKKKGYSEGGIVGDNDDKKEKLKRAKFADAGAGIANALSKYATNMAYGKQAEKTGVVSEMDEEAFNRDSIYDKMKAQFADDEKEYANGGIIKAANGTVVDSSNHIENNPIPSEKYDEIYGMLGNEYKDYDNLEGDYVPISEKERLSQELALLRERRKEAERRSMWGDFGSGLSKAFAKYATQKAYGKAAEKTGMVSKMPDIETEKSKIYDQMLERFKGEEDALLKQGKMLGKLTELKDMDDPDSPLVPILKSTLEGLTNQKLDPEKKYTPRQLDNAIKNVKKSEDVKKGKKYVDLKSDNLKLQKIKREDKYTKYTKSQAITEHRKFLGVISGEKGVRSLTPMDLRRLRLAEDGRRIIDLVRNGKIESSRQVATELATTLANTLSATGQVSHEAVKDLRASRLYSDFKAAINYLTGKPDKTITDADLKQFAHQIQGQIDFYLDVIKKDIITGYQSVKDIYRQYPQLEKDAQKALSVAGTSVSNFKGSGLLQKNWKNIVSSALNEVDNIPTIDPKIEKYAKDNGLDYNRAKKILESRGYKGQ